RVYATKCILGVNGITAEDGITTSIHQETSINSLMLRRCKGERIVVADSSKVGHSYDFISASIDMIDCLITDSDADEADLERLRAAGVKVLVVPAE
ncbi:MAG: DeoR/GlpR transcriptional regulator, partial [Clostridia bacterium]|nr:DeoR/GlpR transcriptional regulator [Clostridia bacterium]